MKNAKSIKINETLKKKIESIGDNSIDKNVNLLIDAVEEYMPTPNFDGGLKSISLYNTTLKRLENFPITPTETRENILTRLMICYEEVYNFAEEVVPFYLQSSINKNLIISGFYNVTLSKFEFNQSSGYNTEKLSPEYIVNNIDMSSEFQAWESSLDWNEIKQYIINYKEVEQILENNIYKLYINKKK